MNDTKHELTHFGVLGMRWGIRRGAEGNSSPTAIKKKKFEPHPDHESAALLKKKKLEEMSNAELKKLLERTDLEKRYRDFNNAKNTHKNPLDDGEKLIKRINTAKQLYGMIPQSVKDKGKSLAGDIVTGVVGKILFKDLMFFNL